MHLENGPRKHLEVLKRGTKLDLQNTKQELGFQVLMTASVNMTVFLDIIGIQVTVFTYSSHNKVYSVKC
jgi:ribosomal protein S19